MGLDMNLTKRTYVKNYENQDKKYQVEIKKDGQIMANIKPERISYIIEDVAEWRNCYSIDQWFIENIDHECCVSHENLKELVESCKKILIDPTLVYELLPNDDDDYEEGYIYELEETVRMLEPLLLEEEEGSFYYCSSW